MGDTIIKQYENELKPPIFIDGGWLFSIKPMSAPRMTKASAKFRGAKYFAWREEFQYMLNLTDFAPGGVLTMIFHIPIPRTKSWPESRRMEMAYQPHELKPDTDNLEKAVLDALFSEDCKVYHTDPSKYWAAVNDEIGSIWIANSIHIFSRNTAIIHDCTNPYERLRKC